MCGTGSYGDNKSTNVTMTTKMDYHDNKNGLVILESHTTDNM